jgi:uncharacterized protein (TIGR02646 family)
MIRINKTTEIPPSLQVENCSRYDGQDVQEALYNNQLGKCYLCEQETHKNYQIEHLKAQEYFPEQKFTWTNLFLTCGYCNGCKPNTSDILDPSTNNIEDILIHSIDLNSKKVEFISRLQVDSYINQTIELLYKLFNGQSFPRKKHEQLLYEDLNREISFFLEMLIHFKSDGNEQNKQIIIDLLHISKEFLGFKFWIIKDSGMFDEFKEFMIWNKKYEDQLS